MLGLGRGRGSKDVKAAAEPGAAGRSNNDTNIMDNWDPMAEVYNDPNLNKYYSGPAEGITAGGSKQPTSSSNYRVHVGGLPVEFKETHVMSVFRAAGHAQEVVMLPIVECAGRRAAATAAAILRFSTPREQMDAIRLYNGHELTDEHTITVQAARGRAPRAPRAPPHAS